MFGTPVTEKVSNQQVL